MTKQYLCIQRSLPQDPSQAKPPSPEQMEAMMAKFHAWKDRYAAEIIDMGGKLGAGGVVTADTTLDGPFAEAK